MNREILFRAKRKDTLEWVYGFLINKHGVFYIIDNDDENIEYEVIRETVGQFTGLTDKNSRKIFDGDIVKTKEFGKDDGNGANFTAYDIFEITYFGAAFKVRNSKRKFYITNGEKYEVIGNIHDNPELLNARKNTK